MKLTLAYPELDTARIETYADLIHEYGGILVHAHPHRIRDYIDPDFMPRYDVCDGIEVYNAGDVYKVIDEPKLGDEQVLVLIEDWKIHMILLLHLRMVRDRLCFMEK